MVCHAPLTDPVLQDVAREAEVGDAGGKAGDQGERDGDPGHGATSKHGIVARLLAGGDEAAHEQRERQMTREHDPVRQRESQVRPARRRAVGRAAGDTNAAGLDAVEWERGAQQPRLQAGHRKGEKTVW
eukprot:COSAG06_NODE_898_length_11667_cov_4.407244_12_plen_129_part_00